MTLSDSENRRFLRVSGAEGAYALDRKGNELGRVANLSSNGLLIHCTSATIADHLVNEGEMKLVLIEPRRQERSSVEVVVRYREGLNVGFEYGTDKPI